MKTVANCDNSLELQTTVIVEMLNAHDNVGAHALNIIPGWEWFYTHNNNIYIIILDFFYQRNLSFFAGVHLRLRSN